MAEPEPETVAPVPDWAVKVLQGAVRDYRYTGDYLPTSSPEKLLLGLRRGDRRVGRLTLQHLMRGPRHLLRLTFESLDDSFRDALTARSLAQLQESAPLLMESVCRYGSTLSPKWCDDCSQRERHAQGQFRRAAPAATDDAETSPP